MVLMLGLKVISNMNNFRFQNIALKTLINLNQRWRFVAVLISAGKPLAVSTNDLKKTSPFADKQSPYRRLHAEMRCLKKASPDKISGSTMYVWRLRNDNDQWGMAKPCLMCQEELLKAEVKKVFYSTENGVRLLVLKNLE